MRTLLMLLLLVLPVGDALSQSATCDGGIAFSRSFDSGASWTFCARLDDQHALSIQNLHYQAPGDISRSVLKNLHLGQLLLHYHDQNTPVPLIADVGIGGAALATLSERNCDGELHALSNTPAQLCSIQSNTGLMAKYSVRPGLQGSQWKLYSVSRQQTLLWQTSITLGEDGRITPAVSLSGTLSHTTDDQRFGNQTSLSASARLHTRASLLFTWRMVFALDNDLPDDRVEEFSFPLSVAAGNRRAMQVTELQTEALRNVERENFRGWRVRDPNGKGYYLDPQNSGYDHNDSQYNWTQFDLALSRYRQCEQHAQLEVVSENAPTAEAGNCDASLDNYVNGESMRDQHPVLWYSQSRLYRPRLEDRPAISSLQSSFDLLPFDWTRTSPFEVRDE